jgi:hypothetical protein
MNHVRSRFRDGFAANDASLGDSVLDLRLDLAEPGACLRWP